MSGIRSGSPRSTSEVMELCGRSIREVKSVDRPSELVQARLWELLDFAVYKNAILQRSNDLERLLSRTQNEGMLPCAQECARD